MKRLIICCDGTWNGLPGSYPTNVKQIYDAILPQSPDGITQQRYYDPGLGTGGGLDKWFGGAFGWGIDQNIQDAYRFLMQRYAPGDEVYLFGFSRGAYTVRSLAGMVYCSGLLPADDDTLIDPAYALYRDRTIKPSSPAAVSFRQRHGSEPIPITLLGCWDTVGALGIPQIIPWLPINDWVNQKYAFHDTRLNPLIRHALHGIAIDERRRAFDVNGMEPCSPTSGQDIREVWFPGTHGCVGGGTEALIGLSDAALDWVVQEMAAMGLGLVCDSRYLPDPERLDHTTHFDAGLGLYRLAGALDRDITRSGQRLHQSTKNRYRDVETYRPINLVEAFGPVLEQYCQEPAAPDSA